MNRRAVRRAWGALWAVLQFALPMLATYADARVERASISAVAHVESQGESTCPPIHAADCALCHIAPRLAAAWSGPSDEIIVTSDERAPENAGTTPRSTERGRLPFSRGPPAV